MPELDSHAPTASNPTPLESRYSPWHACGNDYESYSAKMKQCAHLEFVSATCRLEPGDDDTERAAKQWERLFGVASRDSELLFTNMRLTFVPGVEGKSTGLESITIRVNSKQHFDRILDAASKLGLREASCIHMLGLKWHIVLADGWQEKSRL